MVEHNLAKVGVAGSIPVSRSIIYLSLCMNNFAFSVVCKCPGGGMVDTRDLKSLGYCFRVGSSPTPGTTLFENLN